MDLDPVVALRTVFIYVFTLALIRLGSKRFLSEATAFDVIVAIMLGSVMSRGIDGSSPLLETLLTGAILVGLHWLFAVLAYHTSWFGTLVKGGRVLLIEDGKVQEAGMRRGSITDEDLAQALRIQTKQTDPAKVQLAYLERNGQISVIPKEQDPEERDDRQKNVREGGRNDERGNEREHGRAGERESG